MLVKTKKLARKIIAANLIACLAVIILCGYFYFTFRFQTSSVFSTGSIGLWARHQWVGKSHTEQEYRFFSKRLKENKITDVYFHVGPWTDADGGIPPEKYSNAKVLLEHIHRQNPGVRAHAWIGQITKRAGGPLDLSNGTTRRNIVKTSEAVLNLGFDGIHYDFEPMYNGDPAFIDLLDQAYALTKSRQKLLSVAGGQLELFPGMGRAATKVAPKASFWSRAYFVSVAQRTDQIAVMLYDTGLPADWMYGSYVKMQTRNLAPLLCGKTDLLIGIPSYDENRLGHRPWAENMETALKGVKLGIGSKSIRGQCRPGVAVFADWTTSKKEWKTFRSLWLKGE